MANNPPDPSQALARAGGVIDEDWYRTFLQTARTQAETAAAVEELIAALAALEVKDDRTHTVEKVKNVTARFLWRATTAGRIDNTFTDCASGSCTVRWYINGVAVGSAANSVSTTAQTQTHTTDNEFAAGDVITYTISSNSACLEAILQCNMTRGAA